ncbi:MAG: Rpn family recombination-promoting nuclease/putative transposase [Spirochaetaceae bacterium]|jgi:predicted transposase/invertase (TIGR01784 family)|nr:Rpn family recombination-promoting nuclease/putative transposase [Spirochaetaceae bacterium]
MTLKKLLSPKNDIIFKLIFGDSRNTDILTDFLRSVLTLPEQEYKKISLADPHLFRRHKQDKLGILDIRIDTSSGHAIDVEIQLKPFPGMENRIVWYNAKLHAGQLLRGDNYHTLKKAVSIVITDYVICSGDNTYHDVYYIMSPLTMRRFCDTIEIHTLELPKVQEEQSFPGEDREEKLKQWLRFFKAETTEEYEMLSRENPIIKRAVEIVITASGSRRLRYLYEQKEKARMDYHAGLRGAYDEGRVEGIKQGAEGKAFETAQKMKTAGIVIADIAAFTGLNPEEIEKLH